MEDFDFDGEEFFDEDIESGSDYEKDIFEDDFSESIDYMLDKDSDDIEEMINQDESRTEVDLEDAFIFGTMIFGCASDELAEERRLKQQRKRKRRIDGKTQEEF